MKSKVNKIKPLTTSIILIVTLALLPFVASLNPILGLVLLFAICTLPGYAALELFKFKFETQISGLFYAVMLSLFILMVLFATLSFCCHYLRLEHPINVNSVTWICGLLLVSSVIFLLIRLAGTYISPFHEFSWRIFAPRLFSLLLPCISLICVNRLNILFDTKMTLVFSIFLILLVVISGFDFVKINDSNLQLWIIYGVTLSLILGSTFRGTGGFWGFDINSEYFSASKVMANGIWIPSHASSAYDSMLSITVLPVVLSLFSKLSLTIIFKIFYPFVQALIPTVAYSVCLRFFSRFVSMLVVGSLIIGSISFIPQLPALTREIIGLAYFLGIVLVVFERECSLRRKTILGLLMASGMSISHYSTAYIACILFGFNLLMYPLLSLARGPRVKRVGLVFTPAFSLSLILLTVVWNGVITHSLQDTKPIFVKIGSHGLQILPNSKQNILTRWISGTVPNVSITPAQLKIDDYYRDFKNHITPLSSSSNFVPIPTAAPNPTPILGSTGASAYSKILVFGRIFFQGLAVVGVGYLARMFFRRKSNRWKDTDLLPGVSPLDVFPIGIGALVLGLIARVSGTLASFYNPERAAIQVEVALLIVTAIALERILFREGVAKLILATPVVAFFLSIIVSATSLDGYVLGRDVSRISSLQSNYQPFIISSGEIQATHWLSTTLNSSSVLQTDSRGMLALDQVGLVPTFASIDPYSLVKGAYIYASNSNINGGMVGSELNYKFPTSFINEHFQTVYSSNQARIYH